MPIHPSPVDTAPLTLPYSPAGIGLPAKFTQWRPQQEACILAIVNSVNRFVAQSIPTGVGKSIIYVAAAHLLSARTAILTSTKALQDQLQSDFGSMGLVTLKGANAYPCEWLDDERHTTTRRHNCEQGGMSYCPNRNTPGCPAHRAIKAAQDAQLVSVNYAKYQAMQAYQPDVMGKFDLLVCDEAHNAEGQVCNHLKAEWTGANTQSYKAVFGKEPDYPETEEPRPWCQWAMDRVAKLEIVIKRLSDQIECTQGPASKSLIDERVRAKLLERVIAKIAGVSDSPKSPWIVEHCKPYKRPPYWAFEPVWASDYTLKGLFAKAPMVVLTSATLTNKTLDLLGVPDDDYSLTSCPPIFSKRRGPVYFYPTASVKFNMTREDWQYVVRTISDIIDARPDRRGIVHTVSYKRRDEIMDELNGVYPEVTQRLATHVSARDLQAALSMFWNGPSDTVFISPSIATGYDFHHRRAEYQIICKIPFPDTRNRILQERSKQDPEYPMYVAILELVQTCGRIMRAEDDRGETFILDNNIKWLLWKFRHLVPAHFHYVTITKLPKIPPLLGEEVQDSNRE